MSWIDPSSVVPTTHLPQDPVHVMIDLETYALTPDAVILSIGAVKFNSKGLHSEFYMELDPTHVSQFNRKVDSQTVQWWSEQSILPPLGQASLDFALNEFRRWLNESTEIKGIWCKGTDLDTAILSHAYNRNPPWKYSLTRDCRTLFKIFPDHMLQREEHYILHNALDDAKYQAECVRKILNLVTPVW